ncbi:MAG: hypothetical protein JO015_17560 [Verrucomicrobia bacterium]|nr:hypothetical protein [Verrucomicrobiota bacterium]
MSSFKRYPGIDYSFRPASYWAPPSDPLNAALRNVQGRNRREMIRAYHAEGRLDQLDPTLLADELGEEDRDGLGRIHPTFMGGEYLPRYRRREVEIARIELASTTGDVISIRARPAGSRILYRVSDEYETEYELPQKGSRRPFSLSEFIRFLDDVEQGGADPEWRRLGFVLSFNLCNLDCGSDLEGLRDFTRVDSDIYPELGCHYGQVCEEWYLGACEALARDREEDAGSGAEPA